jgi:uncharacterized protein YlxP (DUF503 family)
MVQHMQINKRMQQVNRIKDKKQVIISINAETAKFDIPL